MESTSGDPDALLSQWSNSFLTLVAAVDEYIKVWAWFFLLEYVIPQKFTVKGYKSPVPGTKSTTLASQQISQDSPGRVMELSALQAIQGKKNDLFKGDSRGPQ